MNEEYFNTPEWLKRFREGYHAEYTQIFDFYYQPLINFAKLFLERTDELEDIVLDVFTDLFTLSHHFTNHPSIKLFLYSNVRNKCSSSLYYFQMMSKIKVELYYLSTNDGDSDFELFTKMDLLQMQEEAISKLYGINREVFISIFIMNEQVEKVAEKLNISPSIINEVISKTLNNLRRLLNPESCPYRRNLK